MTTSGTIIAASVILAAICFLTALAACNRLQDAEVEIAKLKSTIKFLRDKMRGDE